MHRNAYLTCFHTGPYRTARDASLGGVKLKNTYWLGVFVFQLCGDLTRLVSDTANTLSGGGE